MISISGVWCRHLPHGGDPLRIGEPAADGRWQRGKTVGALYLAEEEETAWAEFYRALAESGLPAEMGLPRDLWRYEVEVEGIVDLSTRAKLAKHGLASPRPTRRDWPAFQRVGAECWRAGAKGILYESAARPGSLALCLFATEQGLPGLAPDPPPKMFNNPPPLPRGMRT
jgi:RES domain-containing protein